MRRKTVLQKDYTGIETVKVDKLECASRQMDTAIFLLFNTDDFISVHTLTYAACEILDALLKAKGIKSISEMRDEVIRPEFQKTAVLHFNEAANFFKHGSRDVHAELEFAPAVNTGLIGIGSWALKSLGRPYTPNRLAFLIWARTHMPNYFVPIPLEIPAAAAAVQSFDKVGKTYPLNRKREFYQDFIGVLNTPQGASFVAAFDAAPKL